MRCFSRWWMIATLALALAGARAGEIREGATERAQFQEDMRALAADEKWDELNTFALHFRETRERFLEGLEKRPLFVVGVARLSGKSSDVQWEEWLRKLDRWKASPGSDPDAALVRAEAQIGWAWRARGNGYADKVTPEGWRLFGERLAEANQMLKELLPSRGTDPEFYHVLQGVALGQSWPAKDQARLWEETRRVAPDYVSVFFGHSRALLPRWFGEEGDWEKFAVREADRSKELGDELYTRIAWGMLDYYQPDFFRKSRIEWPRMRAGFEEMRKRYPDSKWNESAFAYFACRAGDRATAREIFERLGDNWTCKIWCLDEFRQCRDWSRREGTDRAPFARW